VEEHGVPPVGDDGLSVPVLAVEAQGHGMRPRGADQFEVVHLVRRGRLEDPGVPEAAADEICIANPARFLSFEPEEAT